MSNQWYDIDSWQWVDSEDAQWGFTTEPPIPGYEGLYQIWTDAQYVYAATTSGLNIIDIETEQRVSFATNPNGYTTVWSSASKVYVGSNRGIKVLNKSEIGPAEIVSKLHDYQRAPTLTSDSVRYIHGNENKLICCTVEGVNVVKIDSNYVYGTSVSGAQKCFITQGYNYCYYTVSGTSDWQLHRVDNPLGNWQGSTAVYSTSSGFLANATCLNDIYVTEHTSVSGSYNTLFIATDFGVYVYDEGTSRYVVYTTVS
jgi:ligand-binding sensor domain-containing protein